MDAGLLVLATLPFIAWVATLFHIRATQHISPSSVSRGGWVLLVTFLPFFLGMLCYWLVEAPRRKQADDSVP